MQLTVTTMQGLEEVLAQELSVLGAQAIVPLKRAVSCEGDMDFLYRANLHLRTALRVLKPIHQFRATDERMYYNKIREIDWFEWFGFNQYFMIHTVVNSTTFTHSKYMALKAKDAIVDQFRDKFGKRPTVSNYEPDLVINIHINEHDCTVSLDSSGEPLHKRGYKVAPHEAPLNEVLAAALLMHSGFEEFKSFHDPMCGSGTFISEALMMHAGIPAGWLRDQFAFMKWKDYQPHEWKKIKETAGEAIHEPVIRFSGADIDRKYMFAARKNLFQLPFGDRVEFFRRDFLEETPGIPPEFLIMNPPYDVRLETEDINLFYERIGTRLKHHYTGSRACIFSGNPEALKHIGLRPTRKYPFLNGALPSSLHIYDLYHGSRKSKDGLELDEGTSPGESTSK